MPELAELIRQRDFTELREILCDFPAPDIAEIFVDLKPDDEAVLLRLLPRELAAEVFEYLPLDDQEKLLARARQRTGRANPQRHRAGRPHGVACRNCPPPPRKNC